MKRSRDEVDSDSDSGSGSGSSVGGDGGDMKEAMRLFAATMKEFQQSGKGKGKGKKLKKVDHGGYKSINPSTQKEGYVEGVIGKIFGDCLLNSEITRIDKSNEIQEYSFHVKYPDSVSCKLLKTLKETIKSIYAKGVVQYADEDLTNDPKSNGRIKIVVTCTSNEKIRLQFDRYETITRQPKLHTTDFYAKMIENEIDLDISVKDGGKSIGVDQGEFSFVSFENDIICPLRFEQAEKLLVAQSIKDISFSGNPKTNKPRIFIEILRENDVQPQKTQ